MTVNVENEVGQAFADFDLEETARQVIEAALTQEDCPYEAEVSLFLTDDAGIHGLNRQFRGVDRPTDVLSFPMVEYAAPADFTAAEAQAADCFNPESGELLLGDIIISADKVREQAAKYGHSERREFAFLIAHSMLHLFGYDHEVPEEAAVMEAKQEAILESLGIRR